MALVLKTSDVKASVGSNPTLSVSKAQSLTGFFNARLCTPRCARLAGFAQFCQGSRAICGTDSERTSRPMEQLQATNEALKSRGVRGYIVVVRQSLFLRETFTASDGTRKDR